MVPVSPHEIRRLFREGGYLARIESGDLLPKLVREGHPSPPQSHQPPCTRSQIIAYLNSKGQRVAIVHQYLRTDGKLGGSGLPDPKLLFHDGKLYVTRLSQASS